MAGAAQSNDGHPVLIFQVLIDHQPFVNNADEFRIGQGISLQQLIHELGGIIDEFFHSECLLSMAMYRMGLLFLV